MATELELLQQIADNTENYHCHRYRRSPVESPDGARVTFTLPSQEAYQSGMLVVRVDGVVLDADAAVTENGPENTTFTLAVAPAAGVVLKIDYILKK